MEPPQNSRGIGLNRRIAKFLMPNYSKRLDQVNWNARWIETIRGSGEVPQAKSRRELYQMVNPDEPITYLEFGVFRGASMRMWCELNQHPESRFVGFDSFEGLPEDWSPMFPKGTFDVGRMPPEIADPRVSFCVGWFQETLPGFLATHKFHHRLVVHCDCDLYTSALFCLTSLDLVLKAGSIIVFGEFDQLLDEYRALIDYSAAYSRRYKTIAATRGFVQLAIEFTETPTRALER
jgi:O-methyltransferase